MTAIPTYIVHFPRVFPPNIFNPPKLLNTTLDDVKVSKKLTSVSPIFPFFKPKYSQQIWIIYEHVSTQVTLAREHVSTQGTLAREHVFSTQGTQFTRLEKLAKICSQSHLYLVSLTPMKKNITDITSLSNSV